ncbi:O-antigen ligase family protein [Chitinivorax sp. B]|uniref:O-antigen ligase family protein n=1 Tax=Chitinivorax sp. B TaxID=2502235 RepID=UPI0010F92DF7|nr:O-antigen ligase family protein [Chitinivorax sp. B]
MSWLRPFGDKPWQGMGLTIAALLTLILPLAHTTALRNVLATLLLMLTGYAVVRLRWRLRFPLKKYWLAYLTVAFLSLIWAVDRPESLGDIKSELLHGLLGFLIGVNWLGQREALPLLRRTMMLMAGIMLADLGFYLIRAYLATGDMPEMTGGYLVGVGKLSSYLIISMPFLMMSLVRKGVERNLSILLLMGSTFALVVTGNRMAFIVIASQLTLAALMVLPDLSTRRRWSVAAMFVAALTVVISLMYVQLWQRTAQEIGPNASVSPQMVQSSLQRDPRWMIWTHTLENPKTPWWHGAGYGITTFKRLYPELSNQPGTELYTHAHNVFLNKYVQLGLPGMLVWATLIVVALSGLFRKSDPEMTGWRVVLAMSLCGALLKVQTDDFFHRDVGWAFWLLAGVAVSLFYRQRATSTANSLT